MKKVIGYIIALVGIIGVAAPLVPQLYSLLPIPSGTPDLYIIIGGVILVVVGLAFLVKRGGGRSSSKKRREVPIYEGEEIVGYRRHKK